MHTLGFYPFQGIFFPTGYHNLFPEFIRPYIPTHRNSIFPFFTPLSLSYQNVPYAIGIKGTPDQLSNSTKSKIYKIITTNNNINDLFDINNFDFEKEEIFDLMPALQLASYLNSFEVAHFLINKAKVDVNSKQKSNGKTPLHYAVESGNELMIKYLINNGADIYETDCYGYDIFDKAEFRGYYNLKSILEKFTINNDNRNHRI